MKFKNDYVKKRSETTGIEIQRQYWDGNRQF